MKTKAPAWVIFQLLISACAYDLAITVKSASWVKVNANVAKKHAKKKTSVQANVKVHDRCGHAHRRGHALDILAWTLFFFFARVLLGNFGISFYTAYTLDCTRQGTDA